MCDCRSIRGKRAEHGKQKKAKETDKGFGGGG